MWLGLRGIPALAQAPAGSILRVERAPAPILSAFQRPQGTGAILHASNRQIISTNNPAGEAIEIYARGLIGGTAIPLQVAIGGKLAEALFFGAAPGYSGMNQINMLTAGMTPRSAVSVWLNYSNRPSNQVTLALK